MKPFNAGNWTIDLDRVAGFEVSEPDSNFKPHVTIYVDGIPEPVVLYEGERDAFLKLFEGPFQRGS